MAGVLRFECDRSGYVATRTIMRWAALALSLAAMGFVGAGCGGGRVAGAGDSCRVRALPLLTP